MVGLVLLESILHLVTLGRSYLLVPGKHFRVVRLCPCRLRSRTPERDWCEVMDVISVRLAVVLRFAGGLLSTSQ